MAKKLILLSVIALTVLIFPAPALAAFGLDETAAPAGYAVGSQDLTGTIRTIVTTVLGFVAIAFFVLVLYGGFVWITARGKEDKVEEAKGILEAAAIGLAIVASAYALTTFVFSRIQPKETSGCWFVSDGSCAYIDEESCESRGGTPISEPCP